MNGLSAALSQLSALPGRVQEASLRSALSAAQEAARKAQGMAPVRTGALRASIAAAPAKTGAQVSAGCSYAAIVELGSLRCPARPYLLPGALSVDYSALSGRAIQEAIR